MADKIFFSYSRSDSDFVLRLANDLRNAGANVWLDQLDISPGSHWDKEIEDALNSSNCLLAILSPKSMESDNAMDEISYALEKNKRVIPVLLTSTETPFRLRRLQRVDFTLDYDTGFKNLMKALKLYVPGTTNPGIPPSNGVEKTEKVAAIPEETKRADNLRSHDPDYSEYPDPLATVRPTSKRKYLMLAAALVILAAGAGAAWYFSNDPTNPSEATGEEKAWQAAVEKNDSSLFLLYLKDYSSGKHAAEAQQKLTAMRSAPASSVDETQAWNTALNNNTVEALKAYQAQFPTGKHYGEAQAKIAALDKIQQSDHAQAEDEKAWTNAVNTNTIASYQNYSREFASGKYLKQAKENIRLLEEQENSANIRKAEELAWNIAVNNNSIPSYQNYLHQYPSGNYATQANQHIETIKTTSDNKAWQAAVAANNIPAYQHYLIEYKTGIYAAEAEKKIREMENRIPDIVGNWINSDAQMNQVSRLIFPNKNVIHAYSKCQPTACDWKEEILKDVGNNIYTAVYNIDNQQTTLRINIGKAGLIVNEITIYRDGRPVQKNSYTFTRMYTKKPGLNPQIRKAKSTL